MVDESLHHLGRIEAMAIRSQPDIRFARLAPLCLGWLDALIWSPSYRGPFSYLFFIGFALILSREQKELGIISSFSLFLIKLLILNSRIPQRENNFPDCFTLYSGSPFRLLYARSALSIVYVLNTIQCCSKNFCIIVQLWILHKCRYLWIWSFSIYNGFRFPFTISNILLI